ncbi:hypothetical protein M9458_048366, partial [Cirrhinus mrigala]
LSVLKVWYIVFACDSLLFLFVPVDYSNKLYVPSSSFPLLIPRTPRRCRDRRTDQQHEGWKALWRLRQGGGKLEWYVEEFLELANQLSWHDAALGACFQLGLDEETIRSDLPVC